MAFKLILRSEYKCGRRAFQAKDCPEKRYVVEERRRQSDAIRSIQENNRAEGE